MNIAYKNNKLGRQFGNATEIKKAFGNMAKMVARRLAEINAATNLAILQSIPGPNCHPLKGDRNGEWAVTISGNYRIIFELDHDPVPLLEDGSIDLVQITNIKILETCDYH